MGAGLLKSAGESAQLWFYTHGFWAGGGVPYAVDRQLQQDWRQLKGHGI